MTYFENIDSNIQGGCLKWTKNPPLNISSEVVEKYGLTCSVKKKKRPFICCKKYGLTCSVKKKNKKNGPLFVGPFICCDQVMVMFNRHKLQRNRFQEI